MPTMQGALCLKKLKTTAIEKGVLCAARGKSVWLSVDRK